MDKVAMRQPSLGRIIKVIIFMPLARLRPDLGRIFRWALRSRAGETPTPESFFWTLPGVKFIVSVAIFILGEYFFPFFPFFISSLSFLLLCSFHVSFLFNFHAFLGFFYYFKLVFYERPCLYSLACFFFRSSIDLFMRLLVGWFACLLCGFFVSQGCSILFPERSVTAVMCAE